MLIRNNVIAFNTIQIFVFFIFYTQIWNWLKKVKDDQENIKLFDQTESAMVEHEKNRQATVHKT